MSCCGGRKVPNINELIKQQEQLKQSRGLGDTVKKVIDKLGIKQCGGCRKRQETLNSMFPYRRKEV